MSTAFGFFLFYSKFTKDYNFVLKLIFIVLFSIIVWFSYDKISETIKNKKP